VDGVTERDNDGDPAEAVAEPVTDGLEEIVVDRVPVCDVVTDRLGVGCVVFVTDTVTDGLSDRVDDVVNEAVTDFDGDGRTETVILAETEREVDGDDETVRLAVGLVDTVPVIESEGVTSGDVVIRTVSEGVNVVDSERVGVTDAVSDCDCVGVTE